MLVFMIVFTLDMGNAAVFTIFAFLAFGAERSSSECLADVRAELARSKMEFAVMRELVMTWAMLV